MACKVTREGEQAWLNQVATDHTHRKQMCDLAGIDRALLRHSEKHLTPLRLARGPRVFVVTYSSVYERRWLMLHMQNRLDILGVHES